MAVPIGVPMNALVFWLWLIFLVFESLYSRRFAYGDALEQPIAYAAVRSKLLVIHCILGVLGLALGIASGQSSSDSYTSLLLLTLPASILVPHLIGGTRYNEVIVQTQALCGQDREVAKALLDAQIKEGIR